jgi:hypothetical protein
MNVMRNEFCFERQDFASACVLKLTHADGEPSFAGKAAEEGRPEHTALRGASSNERA